MREGFQAWLQLANAWKDLDLTAEKGLAAGFKAYGYGRNAAEQVEGLLLMTSILRAQLAKHSESYVAVPSKDLKSSIRKGELLDKDEVAKSGSDIESSAGEVKLTEQAKQTALSATEEALLQIARISATLDEMYKDISLKLPGLAVAKMQAGR